MKFYYSIFLMLFASSSFACVNEHEVYLEKKIHVPSFGGGLLNFHDNLDVIRSSKDQLIADTLRLKERYETTDSIHYLSDYAAALIYAGHTKRAKEIYLLIEQVHPGLYTTASNLGTAYELLGEVDSALHWIRKGFELNPDSHGGSEWVHIKILEFKLRGDTNTLGMFGVDFGTNDQPIRLGRIDHSVSSAIAHQLMERLYFIDAPNRILAQMYFDIGSHLLEQGYAEESDHFFLKADEYGFIYPDLLTERMMYSESYIYSLEYSKEGEQQIEQAKSYLISVYIIGGIIVVMTLVGMCIVVVRTRKRKDFGR